MDNRDFRCTLRRARRQAGADGTGIAVPPLSTYAPRLWDYWARNLDPDLFRERSLAASIGGRKIMITGASSGIGLETALKIGDAGGEVMLVSRTREKLEEVANQVEERGGTAHVHPCDLSDLDDIERLAQEVIERARRRRRPDQQRRPLDPPLGQGLLRPLPRLRAHDAAELLRRAEADPGLPAGHDASASAATSSTSARSARRPTRRASRPTSPRSRRSTPSPAAPRRRCSATTSTSRPSTCRSCARR